MWTGSVQLFRYSGSFFVANVNASVTKAELNDLYLCYIIFDLYLCYIIFYSSIKGVHAHTDDLMEPFCHILVCSSLFPQSPKKSRQSHVCFPVFAFDFTVGY